MIALYAVSLENCVNYEGRATQASLTKGSASRSVKPLISSSLSKLRTIFSIAFCLSVLKRPAVNRLYFSTISWFVTGCSRPAGLSAIRCIGGLQSLNSIVTAAPKSHLRQSKRLSCVQVIWSTNTHNSSRSSLSSENCPASPVDPETEEPRCNSNSSAPR